MSARDQRAGPGKLVYRVGDYDSFLAGMRLEARSKPPLATLNLSIDGDFTNALMSGWARVCDVLSFYQERIANEGYLSTAVERASVIWLAAEIGERRKPAVGARASLALQLISAAGQPESLVVIPGPTLAVQNAPASPTQLPVVFECAERRELKPVWNALAPVVPPVVTPSSIRGGSRSLRLVGTSLGVRPGAALLVEADGSSWLVIVDTVQVDRTLGCTLVTWRDQVELPKDQAPLPVAAVTQFARSAGLFGRTAMGWSDVPDGEKETVGVRAGGVLALDRSGLTPDPAVRGPGLWNSHAGLSAPPASVQALLWIGEDGLLAGTDRGVLRSDDRGATWRTLTLPQPKGWNDILSLHRDSSGTFYAGTAAGQVLSSADGGETWAAMTQTVVPDSGKKQGVLSEVLIDLRLKDAPVPPAPWTLSSPVRSIASRSGASALPEIYVGTDRGVFAMTGDAAAWTPFNASLPGLDPSGAADVSVFALALVDGDFLAAATNRGAYWTGAAEAGWTSLPLGPLGSECSSLAAGPGIVFVGTASGVASFVHGAGKSGLEPQGLWSSPPVFALAMDAGTLYAATGGGIQFLERAASPWDPVRPEWDSLDVQDLGLFEIDTVFVAGLDSGKVTDGLRGRFARFGIVLDADVEVRALFLPVSPSGARTGWELREGQPSARIFRIYDGVPLRVTQLVRNLAGPGDLLAAAGGGPVASLSLGPVVNEEWPDFAIATGQVTGDSGVVGAEIYLDRKIEGIEDGSQLVFAPAGEGLVEAPEVHVVLESEPILHKAYGRQGIVTRIIVAPTEALLAADLRSTGVHLIDRPLVPFTATDECLEPLATGNGLGPKAGRVVTLPGVHGDLAPGRSLQFSGPRPGAVLVPLPGVPADPTPAGEGQPVARAGAESVPALDQQMISPELKAAFAAAGIKLSPDVSVQVDPRWPFWLVRDGDRVWRINLEDGDPEPLAIRATTLYELIALPENDGECGHPTILRCGDQDLRVWLNSGMVLKQRAASSQAIVSEIATIASVATDLEADATIVTLAAPLENLYDPAACRICANVVLATQGETVAGEVLGSGQPSEAGQSFTLHRSPLTYTQDRRGYGIHHELEVRVNGAAGRALRFGGGAEPLAAVGEVWTEISPLATAGPADRVYALTADDKGQTTLHFGDGVHGARLPSGSNNVSATYRTGAGASGNVPAGSLIALRKRPTGIRSVTNPAPATGGTDAEPIAALRRRAPRKFDCCERIVTLGDYEDFALRQTGVGHAQAALIGPDMVWLTLATSDWQPISQAPALQATLQAKIVAARADQTELRIEDPAIVPFNVTLKIDLKPGADSVQVGRRVRSALGLAFGRARRGFGQPVGPQEVEDAAHVTGVAAATVTYLYRTDLAQSLATLVANPALFDAAKDAVQPAEWLVINADGIVLDHG